MLPDFLDLYYCPVQNAHFLFLFVDQRFSCLYLMLQNLFALLSFQEYLRTIMCPPNPVLALAALHINIRDSWSNQELVRFLAEKKAEDPLSQNVLVGLDFSVIDPRRAFADDVDMWFLNWSDDQQQYDSAENGIRKAKTGYWKPVNSFRIPTSTAITGVKIVLEFYEGSGQRTEWVMHEYQVEKNGEANLPQDFKSLCKVFLQHDKNINIESRQNYQNTDAHNDNLESYLQYLAQFEEPQETVAANEQDVSSSKGQHDLGDIDVHDIIATGDYIELNDLIRSEASAPTSENSSNRSMVSEDYIDTEAFLSLKDKSTTDTQNQGHKFDAKQVVAANEQDVSSSIGQHDLGDIAVHDIIATGDYIELNDLLNSEASASTSENSSNRTNFSEDYFDTEAFLNLKEKSTTDTKNQDRKFYIASATRSANVVLGLSEQGFVQIHDNKTTLARTLQKKPVPGGDGDQHSSKVFQQHTCSISFCFPRSHVKRSHSNSSSSTGSSIKSQKEQSTSKFGQIGKKYFCFGSLHSSA